MVRSHGVRASLLRRGALGLSLLVVSLLLAPLQVTPRADAITSCTPDASDLLAYWKLDEGALTTAADSTGNGHTGTLVNGTGWTAATAPTGFVNPFAGTFDGTNDEITAPDTLLQLGTGNFTVSTWAKSTVGDRSVLGHFDNLGAGYRGWGLYFYNTGRVNFFGYGTMGTNDTSYPAANLLDGNWHHVAGVYTRSGNNLTITMYADGVMLGATTAAVGDISIATPMRLGHYTFQPTFNGSLDDVRVYNRALSAAEIANLGGGSCGYFCNGKVATMVGTGNDDILSGTSGNDVIVALGGNDIVNGNNGADTICLGTGNDIGNGGNGNDWISGGTGNDVISGGADTDTLYGDEDSDSILGGTGTDTIDGGSGSDACGTAPDTMTNCE